MTWLNSELIFCFEVLNNDNDNMREKDRVGGKVLATGRNNATVVTVDKDNIMIIQRMKKKVICTVVTVDKDDIMDKSLKKQCYSSFCYRK